jgi:Flp pilus assembly protein TadD
MADAYNNRAIAYHKNGDISDARADYRRALAIDPFHPAAAYGLKSIGR